MPVSRRCVQHFVINCSEPFCLDQARLAKLHPEKFKPKSTPGAPETSWASPWVRAVEEAQLVEARG